MSYDVRIQGATVLNTDSEFDAQMKLKELVESGTDEHKISLYWDDRKLSWSWQAEVSISWN